MISGEPQTVTATQQMYGAQQQMILLQQPSSAPKVIGIFVIIYGAISALLGLIGALGGALLAAESEVFSTSSDGTLQVILFTLLSVGFGIGFIITGVQINNRKKIGVQLSWILIALSLVIGIFQTMLTPTEDLEAVGFDSGAYYALQIGGQVVCNAICGLLVAIPLMVSNSMMDDSSLWG